MRRKMRRRARNMTDLLGAQLARYVEARPGECDGTSSLCFGGDVVCAGEGRAIVFATEGKATARLEGFRAKRRQTATYTLDAVSK